VATSSNVASRPAFRPFTQASDNARILVNLMFVRMVSGVSAGVVRLHFGNAGSDHIDVKLTSVGAIEESMTP